MHPSIELIPADRIWSPSGVMHLIQGAADDTLCGRTPRRGWEYDSAPEEGAAVTCLPCWKERRLHEQNYYEDEEGDDG